jgi:EAL domain-containing protein (putative c-di-GMP-specific phosphodiesterase class I)
VNIIFEPIVDTAQNRVIGYEALSRDARGKLGIQELFKKYAEWGELEELKRDCFIGQMKRAEALGLAKVFLNIDSHILMQCEWVIKPPDLEVVLEVSESESIQDVESYLALAERWRDKGFQFAIDDFGAGFISLPFLSRLKPEYIKIDRSVMLRSVASSEFRLFLKKLVTALQSRTCHQMIAEGIETETESRRVVEVGIHLVQGFLLKEQGHPVLLNVPKD